MDENQLLHCMHKVMSKITCRHGRKGRSLDANVTEDIPNHVTKEEEVYASGNATDDDER